MARLKRRADGEYIVTSVFRRHGTTIYCTYQVEDEGLERLAHHQVREGQHIPDELFFDLLREGLLFTDHAGPGEERDDLERPLSGVGEAAPPRQIPFGVTDELLGADGAMISLGAFLLRYHGPGRTTDVLRTAYWTLYQEYLASLPSRLRDLLETYSINAIRSDEDRVIVQLKPRQI